MPSPYLDFENLQKRTKPSLSNEKNPFISMNVVSLINPQIYSNFASNHLPP